MAAISAYELERLLKRVEQGVTTVKDAETLRRLLVVHSATDAVAPDAPRR